MDDISRHLGVNRIVAAVGIPYPCGNPNITAEADVELRREITYTALKALTEGVTAPTLFKPGKNMAAVKTIDRRAA
jgi:glycine reductase